MNYRKLFCEGTELVSPPQTALRLIELAQQTSPDYQELARWISLDSALCGRLLRTVNSALFGFKGRIEDINDAIPKLGLALIRTLLLGFHLSDLQRNSPIGKRSASFFRRCLAQAVVAEYLGRLESPGSESTYFLAGMLQDVGRLAILSNFPDEYLGALEAKNALSESQIIEVEQELYGITHPEISVALLQSWAIEPRIVQAVSKHHQVFDNLRFDLPVLDSALQAASLGGAVLADPAVDDETFRTFEKLLATRHQLCREGALELLDRCNHQLAEYALLFGFNVGTLPSNEAILRKAQRLLFEISTEALTSQALTNQAAAENNELVFRDELTGCYNRRFLSQRLLQSLEANSANVGILFVDIDEFKRVNDTHGHCVGDQVIKKAAEKIEALVRNTDLVIRYGGDEFLVVLFHVDRIRTEKIGTRITAKPIKFQGADGKADQVTLSLGATHVSGQDLKRLGHQKIIETADQAMFNAKRDGRGRTRFHDLCEPTAS